MSLICKWVNTFEHEKRPFVIFICATMSLYDNGGYHKSVHKIFAGNTETSLLHTHTHFISFTIFVMFATFTMVIPGEPFNINNTVDLYIVG